MNIQEKGDIGSESRPVRVSSRLEEALWVWGKSWETVANAEEVKRSGLEWGGRLILGLCLFLCVKWGLGGKLFNTEVVNCVLYNPSGCCNMTVRPKRAKKKNLEKEMEWSALNSLYWHFIGQEKRNLWFFSSFYTSDLFYLLQCKWITFVISIIIYMSNVYIIMYICYIYTFFFF